MTQAARLADKLEAYLPFAPLGVAEIAEEELDENGHRLSPTEKDRFEGLADQAHTTPGKRRKIGFSCAFPVVLEPGGRVSRRLRGLVLEIRACLSDPWKGEDMQPLLEALQGDLGEDRSIEHLLERSGIRAFVAPHPDKHQGVTLALMGESLEGAVYLAVMAALEGKEIDKEVVVSVALSLRADGPYLVPVNGCATKHAVLERERPGCTFYCFPAKGEKLPPDVGIKTVVLGPGHAQKLFEQVFGEPVRGEEDTKLSAVVTEMHFARQAFFDQRYIEAEELFDGLDRRLDAFGDECWHPQARAFRFEVAARQAALLLHSGRWEQAQPVLERLRRATREHEEIDRLMYAEVVTDAASARIDALDPDGAVAILERDLGDVLTRLSIGGGLLGEEKLTLLTIYGAWRRVHLLRGETGLAVDVQDKLLRLAPQRERARALADLGECLHRNGDFAEAMRTWGEADAALEQVPSYYRVHTRAFLEYYRARADLVSAEGSTHPRELAERALAMRESVREDSAAHWRLTRLQALARWVHGERGALEDLIRHLHEEPRAYQRWCYALDLLWAARLARRDEQLALQHAATALGSQPLLHYPELEANRSRFCAAALRGEFDSEATDGLLLRRVY